MGFSALGNMFFRVEESAGKRRTQILAPAVPRAFSKIPVKSLKPPLSVCLTGGIYRGLPAGLLNAAADHVRISEMKAGETAPLWGKALWKERFFFLEKSPADGVQEGRLPSLMLYACFLGIRSLFPFLFEIKTIFKKSSFEIEQSKQASLFFFFHVQCNVFLFFFF